MDTYRLELRGEIYRLLSSLYYPPGEGTEAALAALRDGLSVICPQAAACLAGATRSGSPAELAVDHARLFVGPFQLLAPPYGSVYLEGKREVMGHTTQDAVRRYRGTGLALADDALDAPDHIAFELEFVYYLLYKQIEELSEGNRGRWLDYRAMRRDFLSNHLAAWLPAFAQAVGTHATTAFYRDLAAATACFVQQDLKEISADGKNPCKTVHELEVVNCE